jgi:murein DD-endopeptidase MepM/ murein hydrolase activator NlpD
MHLHKQPLIRPQGRRFKRRRVASSKGSSILVVGALLLSNYLLFFSGDEELSAGTDTNGQILPGSQGENLGPKGVKVPTDGTLPGLVPIMPGTLSPVETDDFGAPIGRQIAGKLKRGNTVLEALSQEGIEHATAMPVIKSMEKIFDFRLARVGNSFRAWVDDEGQLTRFLYQHGPIDIYEVTLEEDGSYAARRKAVPTRTQIARVGCAIRSSLYESIKRCGGGTQLGAKIMDLYAWDVDFFQDVRRGDEFRVLVEKIFVNGRFLKYGAVLAAEYHGKFGRHRLVQYTDQAGERSHFTPAGRAAQKDFLKSPLKYTLVSAGTQSNIRGSLRKASPIVYTAKSGTPVWAVSPGTVVYAGRSGSLGNTVTIRHKNGFTSTYGHLSRVARGMKIGAFVNQKTVIGKVGATGNTKTPQLLFSLRKKGRLVNPLKMHATEADPISDDERARFDGQIEKLLKDLDQVEVIGIHERRS